MNGNGIPDASEDHNGDTVVDAVDCQGPPGPMGPQGIPGHSCWDLDGNGVGDLPAEDMNGDGSVDAFDCQGPEGPPGPQGGVLPIVCPQGLFIREVAPGGQGHCAPEVPSWLLAGNWGTSPTTHFLGTMDSVPLVFKVDNRVALTIYPNFVPTLTAGYPGNWIDAGIGGAVIAGGGEAGRENRVQSSFGTVSGGVDNIAAGYGATVAGGSGNSAIGPSSAVGGGSDNEANADDATVAGGRLNQALGARSVVAGGTENVASAPEAAILGGQLNSAAASRAATVGGFNLRAQGPSSLAAGGSNNIAATTGASVIGGNQNYASGPSAAVLGGDDNDALGLRAVTLGGRFNVAEGSNSIAAGGSSWARHGGTFVWSDGTEALQSSGSNQFLVRSSGGVWFGSAGPPSLPGFLSTGTGAYLSWGGAWTDASDRNLKEEFAPVQGREVLARLLELPISTWSYRADPDGVRHLGPMAQDFHAAFGLGADDKHIAALDSGGVALAAIQGLHEVVEEKERRIAELEARLAGLEARLALALP